MPGRRRRSNPHLHGEDFSTVNAESHITQIFAASMNQPLSCLYLVRYFSISTNLKYLVPICKFPTPTTHVQ